MGTDWSARFYVDDETSDQTIRAAFETLFHEIIAELSTWDDTSFISRLNKSAPGIQFEAPPHFRAVWESAQNVITRSEGAFFPFSATSESAASETGCVMADGFVQRPSGYVFDLSAIGKGYAVDQMGEVLRSRNINAFLVEIGGEFLASGLKPDGLPWWIDLADPQNGPPVGRAAVFRHGLATSGHQQNSELTVEGFTSHIHGAEGAHLTETVSVIASDCMSADAWATALIAAGDKGVALAEENEIAAIFYGGGGKSPRLTTRAEKWSQN